jgi:hypothetical protein
MASQTAHHARRAPVCVCKKVRARISIHVCRRLRRQRRGWPDGIGTTSRSPYTASCAACSSLQHLAPSVAANAEAQLVRACLWRNTRRARPLTHALRAAREHARRAAGRACRAPRSLAWRCGAEALFRRTQLAARGRVRRAAAAEPHHRDTCNRPPVSAVCLLDAAVLQQLTRAHAGTCCVRFAPCRRRTALLAR